jgi:WD40 repeat protein
MLTKQGFSQNKYDQNWLLGYPPNDVTNHYGGTHLNFENNELEVSFFNIEIVFAGSVAAVSDKNGNLVAYTNGCQIQNREHLLMENGDTINPGILHLQQCNEYSGYPGDQNVLFVPAPGNDSTYYLFHMKKMTAGSVVWQLLYSVIDASENNGLGKVTQKNVFLEQDTFTDMLSAARHANGRDWWLMVAESYKIPNIPPGAKGKYHRYLIDPQGIHGPQEQQIGKLWSPQNYIGQACFSPDGSKYVIVSIMNGVHLFDFNRCTGLLSDFVHIDLSQDTVWFSGAAFSPDSRLLYITTGLHLLQFDLWAGDITASKKVVATYDNFLSPFPTPFFQLLLAPDQKIYGTAPNGVDVMHVIHQPNQLGSACQVEPHGLKLPTYHRYTVPNFAHYRLYDLPGSPCDTLGINGPPVAAKEPKASEIAMKIAPNPVSNLLKVQLKTEEKGLVKVSDLTGKIVLTMPKRAGHETIEINTSNLSSGIYFTSFQSESGHSVTRKMVVQH